MVFARGYADGMSDPMTPTPEPDPVAEQPPLGEPAPPPVEATPEAPIAGLPAADVAPPAWPAAYPPPGAPAYPPPSAPAYPPPGAPAAPATQTSSNAIIALVLAVISWAICPIIPAVVALVLASNATKEINASGGRIEGAGLVTAARIVAWINIGVFAAALVVGAFFLVLAIVAGSVNGVN